MTRDFIRDLRYILVDGETKRPIESGWGWTEDDRRNIYGYDELLDELEERSDVGVAALEHQDFQLVTIDVDWTNMAESDSAPDPEDVTLESNSPHPIVHSPTTYEGDDGEEYQHQHHLLAIDSDVDLKIDVEGIDLKGEAGKGYSLFPPTSGYEFANEFGLPIFVNLEELQETVTLDGEPILERDINTNNGSSSGSHVAAPGSVYELPDINRSDYPEGERRGHPYHHSSTGANFHIDSGGETWRCWHSGHEETGTLLHLIGVKHDVFECGVWGDRQLTADEIREVKRIADEEYDIDLDSPRDLSPFMPTNRRGQPAIQDAPPQQWSPDEPLSLQTLARGGKSWALVSLLKTCYTDGYDGTVVFECPSHDEGEATLAKFQDPNTGPVGQVDVAHLVGRRNERARDIPSSGEYRADVNPKTPDQAAEYEQGNVYAAYVDACLEADVIIAPPALLNTIADEVDVDLLVTAEEGVMKKMRVNAEKLFEVVPNRGDRTIEYVLPNRKADLKGIKDRIEDLEQKDEHHVATLTAINHLLEIIELIEDWNPDDWRDVHFSWHDLTQEINRVIDEIPDFNVDHNKIRREPYAGSCADLVLTMLYADGLHKYGEVGQKNPDDPDDPRMHRKPLQLYLCPEPQTPAYELPDDCTIWAGGAIRKSLDMFHDLYGDVPDVWAFQPQTRDMYDGDLDIFAFTGGKNPSHQKGAIREVAVDLQQKRTDLGILSISGSSSKAAWLSSNAMRAMQPSDGDDLETLKRHAEIGGAMCISIGSRFANGVDTNFFELGLIDHAFYASPLEDYMAEQLDDPAIAAGYKMSDAQNAMLRVSNIPGDPEGNTGDTPVVVPDQHMPNALFDVLDAFGYDVHKRESLENLKGHLVAYFRNHGYDLIVDETGRFKFREEGDGARMSFDELQRQIGNLGPTD